MCGIAGILRSNADEAAISLHLMLDAMHHRGPDGRGTMRFAGGAAGMVRLALVDLHPRSQQPMWSEDKKVAILFNGEMFNFREERARLEQTGAHFHTTSDTEVVLALYREDPIRFVDRVRGMYAVAILDFRNGDDPELTLARDPLGIKPLYLVNPPGRIIFSSEIRAMLASGLVAPVLDNDAIDDFLTHGFVVQPRSILRGVRMLEAGTLERYSVAGLVQRERFWSLPPASPSYRDAGEAASDLRAILDESIRIHALADAPVGAFLSGGVDSAGIVALMRRHVPSLRTYTLRFPDLIAMDEAAEAAESARILGVAHEVVDVLAVDVADNFASFCSALDQPSADGLNTWLVSRGAARGVKGVLSGVGADEWFCGYPVARRVLAQNRGLLSRGVRAAGVIAEVLVRESERLRIGDALRTRAEHLAARRSMSALWTQAHLLFCCHDRTRLLGRPQNNADDAGARFLGGFGRLEDDPIALATRLDAEVYMKNQLLRDKDATSMAHSLELRVPFVDIEIASFARRCPDRFKLAAPDGVAKKVMIDALGQDLPLIVTQRPKRGFALPIAAWMRGALREQIEDLTSSATIRARGLLDDREVARLFPRNVRGAPREIYPRLYALAVLESWCGQVLDRRRKPANSVKEAA